MERITWSCLGAIIVTYLVVLSILMGATWFM